MSRVNLESGDRAMLEGADGPARQMAMEIVVEMAEIVRAPRLIDIESAHIDGCLPFGRVALDFPERLLEGGGRVAVPTTLNVSALDLLHPELPQGDAAEAQLGREIAASYEALGCQPTWTCAPYQLPDRPAMGTHVAWAESNAIVFANSVLGARTGRYGDFFDICAALTGRVPEAGLHITPYRRAGAVFRVDGLDEAQLASDLLFPLLGTFIGERTGSLVPAIVGLPVASEDQLKALGAAAASAGSVAMFHAVGITPEAATLQDATQGQAPELDVEVRAEDLRLTRARLSGARNGRLTAVTMGTPHFSFRELEQLRALLAGRAVHADVAVYASTARDTYARAMEAGLVADLEGSGVTMVVDTCTYVRPLLDMGGGTVLTSSAKWAWYAPMTLRADVAIGSLADCVESAIAGRLVLSDGF